jgi:amino acid adenylation domain-containing protein
VGTPVANRNRGETEPLIGFFVNTLALRTGAAAGTPFGELLGRTRETALAAYAHQDLPFERLVEELAPERDLSRTPIVQVAFSLLPPPGGRELAPGLSLANEAVDLGTAKFDLSLAFERGADGFASGAEYAADLFDAATVARMLSHLQVLLAGIVADPGARISELPLLAAAEKAELTAWNHGLRHGALHPEETTVRDLFDAQAARTPDAPAVVTPEGDLTYAELRARALRIAARLAALGVGPEVPVAVHCDRTAGLAVGFCAVLEAGGVYVPVDPTVPAERIALLLADAGCAAVLTETPLPASVAEGAPVLSLDPGGEEEEGEAFVPPALAPANLAYVIYTSGSTGAPKGVGVPHGAAAAHAVIAAGVYRLGPGRRKLLFASSSFDVSVEDMLATLLSGAALVPRGAALPEPAELTRRIAALGITDMNLPPAYWAEWVRSLAEADSMPATPHMMIVGGDEMPAEAVRLYHRSPLRHARLLNGYGPTETVVTATVEEVGEISENATGPVPIGHPMPGRSAWVVDGGGSLLPLGVPGELVLGGLLARGYRGQPALSAAKFVPDPFSDEPGARLYRTGDLARRRPDGRIEFLGRVDHQVKIRGFRIEPGEIEATLLRHPKVAAAVVMARTGGPDKFLAAYVVPGGEEAPEIPELKAFLAERLPAHMVPAAFVVLPAFPLTPSGKVDRRALPAPERGRPDDAFLPPRTPLEAEVAGIWGDVLGIDQVGLQDGFFDLGGHSLLATRVLARIEEAFGVELPLQTLFESPTLEGFAAALGQKAVESMDGISEEELALLIQEESLGEA